MPCPESGCPRVLILDELGSLLLGSLVAPARVSVAATTEHEQDQKNDQYGFHNPTSLMKAKTPATGRSFLTLSG